MAESAVAAVSRAESRTAAQVTQMEEDRVMGESEQYFAFLFARWKKEQVADMKKSPKDVQEAVWLQWCERPRSVKADDKGLKKKKIKDPNEPKKPLSAFMLFKDDNMALLKAEQPNLKPTEVMKQLGRDWGELGHEEKQAYLGRAIALTQDYDEQMKLYKASLPPAT